MSDETNNQTKSPESKQRRVGDRMLLENLVSSSAAATRRAIRWPALCLALLLVAVLCGSCIIVHSKRMGADPSKLGKLELKDGTFEGTSFKFPAKMKVSVKIEKGKIADVKILQHFSPKKHSGMVLGVVSNVIEKQTADVDNVTGATMSSKALKRAVADALIKARKWPADK